MPRQRKAATQGGRANREGQDFRDAVAAILAAVGVFQERHVESRPGGIRRELEEYLSSPLFAAEGAFARNVYICRGIYGKKYHAPFIIWRRGWSNPVVMLSNTQTAKGSIDSKLPYLFENITRCVTLPVALLLDGDAFLANKGLMGYVEAKVAESPRKIRRLFYGTNHFRQWVSDGMPLDPEPQGSFA